jgi:hypothetical protein
LLQAQMNYCFPGFRVLHSPKSPQPLKIFGSWDPEKRRCHNLIQPRFNGRLMEKFFCCRFAVLKPILFFVAFVFADS